VTQQVKVCLTIGRYNDRVLYDVTPMEANHILLGRPWQYDTKAVHDGFTNKISFQHHDWKIIHKPLSPREVCDDQSQTYQRNHCDVYPDLSSLTGSDVIQKLYNLYQAIRS